MSACSLCGGTLRDVVAVKHADLDADVPCPACLSVPATYDILQFAREWLGPDIDLWRAHARNQDWRVYEGTFHVGKYVARLPLYLPGGTDLGMRLLAHQTGKSIREIWRALATGPGALFDLLWPAELDDGSFDWDHFAIPEDAPWEIRVARALVLCIEPT